MSRNSELPRHLQLGPESFQTTDFVYAELEEESNLRLLAIRREGEKRAAEAECALEKIRNRFFAPVEAARAVVKGIRCDAELLVLDLQSCNCVKQSDA